MRALRTVAGLLFVLVAFAGASISAAGWIAMSHRDGDNRFTGALAAVHTDGYAVVVPDLADQADRYGLRDVLGNTPVRIGVAGSSAPVILALAPATDVRRYLAGVARTEITAVGYAAGAQPVSLAPVTGQRQPEPMLGQSFWLARGTSAVDWSGTREPVVSLVAMRADGQPGLDVTLTVARDGGWLTTITWTMVVAGVCGALGALVLLFWPGTKPEQAPAEPPRAGRIAERLGLIRRATAAVPSQDGSGRPAGGRTGWAQPDGGRDALAGNQRAGYAPADQRVPANERMSVVAEPRWRRNSRFPRPEQRDAAARPDPGPDDPTGESPYIYTAT